MSKYTDYLIKDAIVPDGQNYCVMSLFMNDNKKDILCIKVAGAFKTVDEAQEQIQILKQPGHYNFVAEMGTWNAFDPMPNNGDLNEQLNKIMERYLISMHRKNYEYEQRKYNLVIQNMNENIDIKMNELKELEEDTEESKEEMIRKVKNQLKSLEEKAEEYKVKLEDVNGKLDNIKIDSKFEANQVPENFNQNVPVKFEGLVKRTEERVSGQDWYCITFLTEENTSLVGIKVSGCFDSEENANNHSAALRDINESFNILVGKMYEWCPFNPDPDTDAAGESEYANVQLNETMKKKKENEQKAKLYNEFRKNEMIRKNLEELISSKKKENEDNSNELSNMNNEMKNSMEVKITTIEEQIKKLEEKMNEYKLKEKELADKIGPNMLGQKVSA